MNGSARLLPRLSLVAALFAGMLAIPALPAFADISGLTISKSFSPNALPVGQDSTLNFHIGNATGSSQTSIGFTDAFPSGLSVANAPIVTNSCGGSVTAPAGATSASLAGGSLANAGACDVSLRVHLTASGTSTNSVSVQSLGGSGGSSSATITGVLPPTITKSFAPSSVALFGSTVMTLAIANPNATLLTGISVTDAMPSGLFITSSTPTGSCGSGTITVKTQSPQAVSLSNASLPGNGSCHFSVTVQATQTGPITNATSPVSSNEGGFGPVATATLNSGSGPPTLGKNFGSSTIPLNGVTSLTFTVTNPNSSQTQTGVGFTDNLPAGLVVATPNGLTGTCGGGTITAAAGSSTVSLSGASLASSGTCTFSVSVKGTTTGVKTNTTSGATSVENGTGMAATASLTVVGPPALTKTFGASSIPVGGSTTLSFAITNPNTTVDLTDVSFTDVFPSGMEIANPNGLSSTCGGSTAAAAGGTVVTLTAGALTHGGSCLITLTVVGTTAGVKTNTTGTISSTQGGTGPAATRTITVGTVSVSPPVLDKSFDVASVELGGIVPLNFAVSNPNAGTTLTGIGFTDSLPAGLVVDTPNGLVGSCGGGTISAVAGSSTISLAGATLAPGASCGFSLDVLTTTTGLKTNVTSAVSSVEGGDGDAASDLLNVTTGPSVAPDLIVRKHHHGTFSFGSPAGTYTLDVGNIGTAQTTGQVLLSDTPPAGMQIESMHGSGWFCQASRHLCSRSGALQPGSFYSPVFVTVSVLPGTPSIVTNLATVGGGGESDASNDFSNDVTRLGSFPDVIVVKRAHGAFSRGHAGSFTLVVRNVGVVTTSGPIFVVDIPPSGMTVTGMSGSGWFCQPSLRRCSRSDHLAPGGSFPQIVVTVAVSSGAASHLVNAGVTAGGGQANTSNDVSHALVTVG